MATSIFRSPDELIHARYLWLASRVAPHDGEHVRDAAADGPAPESFGIADPMLKDFDLAGPLSELLA